MVPPSNIATRATSCAVSAKVQVTSTRWFRTAAAVFFVFLWGSAFVPSKIGVLDSSPLWFLVVRFAVSGALALGDRGRRGRALAARPAQPGRRSWCSACWRTRCTWLQLRGVAPPRGRRRIGREQHQPAGAGSARAGVARASRSRRAKPSGCCWASPASSCSCWRGTERERPNRGTCCWRSPALLGSVASTIVFKRFLVETRRAYDHRAATLRGVARGVAVRDRVGRRAARDLGRRRS